MANITWTPQALKDLQAIEQYYQQAAPDFAGIIVNSLLEATKRLELFPESGRRSEMNQFAKYFIGSTALYITLQRIM